MKKIIAILGLMMFCLASGFSNDCYAQQMVKVTGLVIDDEGPVIGATVVLAGTSLGTITDLNGQFRLLVPESALSGYLIVSCVGYESAVVMFKGPNEQLRLDLFIILREESEALEELSL